MDKKNRLSTDYDDEDMNWLDDDDDYLEEGGILSSLLFGDKKKKKRSKADSSRDDDRRSRRPTDVHEKREEKTDVSEPRRTRAASGIHGERTGKSVRSVRRVGDEQSTGIDNVYMDETASARDRQSERPARRRKISSDRTPVRLDEGTTRTGRTPVRHDEEKAKTVRTHAASAGTVGEYDEYYHENSRSRKLRDDRTAQKKENASGKHTGRSQRSGSAYAADSARTSVDNLLREVNNLEVDSKQRHEDLRREAWERTQRNVAKAKAEVERLELEREKNEKEEARKKKVREEMERRQAESEKQREQENTEKEVRSVADNSEEDNNKTEVTLADTAEKSVDIGPDDMGSDDAGGKSEAVESVISDDQTEEPKEESYEESGEDDNITFSDNADESSTKEEKPRMKDNRSDMLNMDALEQIERDIDEDKLRYSESDTEDLGLGDIGRALGFDASAILYR